MVGIYLGLANPLVEEEYSRLRNPLAEKQSSGGKNMNHLLKKHEIP